MKRIFSSVKSGLMAIIGVAAVASALLLSHYASQLSREQLSEDQAVLLQNTASRMATQLAHDMNARADDMWFLAHLTSLQDPRVSPQRKSRLLVEVHRTYPHYAWIGLTDAQGRIVSTSNDLLVGANVAQRDWFVEGRKGLYFGNVHNAYLLAKLLPLPVWDDQPLRLVDVAVPVYGPQGEFLGVLCAHLSLDWAYAARASMLDQLNLPDLDLLVLDADGKVLMGTPELPTLKLDLGQLNLYQGLADQASHVALETWPDGSSYLAAGVRDAGYRRYTGLGWIVVARRSADAAFAPARALGAKILVGGLGVAVLFIALLWLLMQRMLGPLAPIARAARAMHVEGTHAPIPEPRGRGELAEFSRALIGLSNDLHAKNEHLRLISRVFDESGQGIMITDSNKRILRVNRAFTRITGYDEPEVLGRTPAILSSGRHAPSFYEDMWEVLQRTGRWQGEIWNRNKNGTVYPEMLVIESLRDEQGAISHFIGIFDDVSVAKENERRLQYLANYDTLTGLPNRHLIRGEVETLLADAGHRGTQLCLALIDLHKFKHINDTQGHAAGDAVLKEVAQRFTAALQPGHVLARWEGDEFVVVMPGAVADAPALQMQALLDCMKPPFEIEHHRYHLGLRAGLAHYPADAGSVDSLLRCADTAVFRAKRDDDDARQFCFYEPGMNTEVERFLRIDNALRRTLANGGAGLQVVFQPQFSPDGRQIVSAEALIRWTDAELGPLSPGHFIPVAEESGQILPLGRWIVGQVCLAHQQMRAAGLAPIPLAVNFSALQLRDPTLEAELQQACAAAQVSPHDLVVEVTESAIMADEVATLRNLASLQARGFPVSIDDFGTGYSSLSYVQKIKPAELKIDQSFVSKMLAHQDSYNIVSFSVGLARSLGVGVVAEGVELEEQRAALQALGPVRIQGYLLGKPKSLQDFINRRLAMAG